MEKTRTIESCGMKTGDYFFCGWCGSVYKYRGFSSLILLNQDDINELVFDNPKAFQSIQKLTIEISKRIALN